MRREMADVTAVSELSGSRRVLVRGCGSASLSEGETIAGRAATGSELPFIEAGARGRSHDMRAGVAAEVPP